MGEGERGEGRGECGRGLNLCVKSYHFLLLLTLTMQREFGFGKVQTYSKLEKLGEVRSLVCWVLSCPGVHTYIRHMEWDQCGGWGGGGLGA